MKGRQKLYDASAFLNLLLNEGSNALSILSGQKVLDLTLYEIGNSIWRIQHLQKKITKEEACLLLDSCIQVISSMTVLDVDGLENQVKEIASDNEQSFYDSAYLAVAKKYGLELVTDDKKLLKVASDCKIKVSESSSQ
ncbi:MAG: type II toxin-antitoxin system VapC family toxin [Candidatus Nitrosotenuis sp.]